MVRGEEESKELVLDSQQIYDIYLQRARVYHIRADMYLLNSAPMLEAYLCSFCRREKVKIFEDVYLRRRNEAYRIPRLSRLLTSLAKAAQVSCQKHK